MRRWSPSLLLLVLVGVGAGPVSAQGVDSNRLILSRDRNVEVLLVDDQAGGGASSTLGWFYYDELVDRGYIDIGDPANPNDDVLRDVEGNGIPDFHEDLFNLNPDRVYIGESTRCIPERIFFHRRESGEVLRLREPELLTGSCLAPGSYAADAGPKRWPDGAPGYPVRPGGSVVGQRVLDATDLVTASGDFRPGVVPGLVDAYFSDRGVFPHVPNLLEPDDSQNGHLGLGHIILLSTDDDGSLCPASPAVECLTPRVASPGPGEPASLGPIWDRSGLFDGRPDYKASAFDPFGRVIPGRDVTAAITEDDRRVRLGTVDGGREIVFFLVTYVEQIYGGATDTCFLPGTTPEGRLQCELWGHGDINVHFSKTLLNLDLHQQESTDVLASIPPREWLSPLAYNRLGTQEYGKFQITETIPIEAWSDQQRTPHVLMLAPMEATDTWLMGWESMNSGGNRMFYDGVFLVRGVGIEPTVTRVEGQGGPVIEGELAFFTATVTTVDGVPLTMGSVSFYVDGDHVTSELLDGAGTATVSLSFFPMGEHTLLAEFGGIDGLYAWSNSEELPVFVEAPDGGSLPDAGAPDSGTLDAGPDGGPAPADAGEDDDAGTPPPMDAGEDDDGGTTPTPDAGDGGGTTPEPDAGDGGGTTPEPDAGDGGGTTPEPDAGDGGGTTPEPDAGDGGGTTPEPDAGDGGGTTPEPDAGDGGGTTPEPDAGDGGGTTPEPEPDAGEDGGVTPQPEPDAGENDAGTDDAGSTTDPEGPNPLGPRDLTVTGWGCGATDAGSSSLMMLALWVGVSVLRSRGRRLD
ncbi:Ig-like domain repeat protein [Myxococcus llanfairpwllgwyngyllgogerychwyrndrobwllllantysiliogogogochensis]|nr:Ig-like domain repeat protein [Myxococcus llanfairpwllgwyngyllgogerychwyrndrobwllllantysiliogogogochensis]